MHRKFLEDPLRPLLVLVLIAIAVRLLMTVGTNGILWPDSRAYYRSAALMAKFGNFHWHEIYRTPLYPMFMAPFLWTFGQTELAGLLIIVAQRLLGVLSVVLLYKLVRKNFGPGIAFYSSLLLALHTLLLYYETAVHTESLFSFLLLVTLYAGDKFFDEPGVRRAAWLGALCALLTLTRPLGQFVLPVVLLVFLMQQRFTALWWKSAAVSCSVFAAVLLPWMFTNKVYYKFFGVSQDLGLNLFHRVIDVERITPKEDTEYPRVKRVWDAVKDKHRITYFHVYHGLLRERMRRVKADRIMVSFSMETLMQNSGQHLPSYFKNVGITFYNFFFRVRKSVQFCGDAGGPYLCTKNTLGQREKAFANNAAGISTTERAAVQRYFKIAELPMAFISLLAWGGFFVALAKWRSMPATAFMMLLTASYFGLLTAVFNIPEDRFRLPVDPILFCFAGFFVAWVWAYLIGRKPACTEALKNAA